VLSSLFSFYLCLTFTVAVSVCVYVCVAWLCEHDRGRHKESVSHVKTQQSTKQPSQRAMFLMFTAVQ